MQDAIFYIDASKPVNLQNQIRQKLVEGILNGSFPPGTKLPSSRKLASQLNVARNTVVAAYQQLIVEGYLVSRQRSGIFVCDGMLDSRVGYGGDVVPPNRKESAAWQKRFKRWDTASPVVVQDLPNWQQYPYPFIDGKFDPSLFPLAEWREATRLALSVADVRDWSLGSGDADDPMLVEQIRSKLLTRRGIQARPDEILITAGAQNGLYLISQLLTDRGTTAAIEEPGNFEMRHLLRQGGARIKAQPVDAQGMLVDQALAECDLIYTTPSHQIPTAVVMSQQRREQLLSTAFKNDLLIVEDDYECEINYLDHPQPALRSMDDTGRVIYVAGFSKVLGPGLRLGFIVADSQFIHRARTLRRTIMNHPPLNNQRAAAFFLSLGHYDALMSRLGRLLHQRRSALHDALNWMRGVPMKISPEVGGTTYWVRMPDDFDVDKLISAAAKRGILVEPVSHYYANADEAENCFRMGITSIDIERIRPGVTRLVELIRSQVRDQVEQLSTSAGDWLVGHDLEAAMAGATILYREVDGAPCTIRYHRDGSMSGVLGYSNEEQDTGRWWTDGERFFRKWARWNYGEEKGYYIVIDGDQVKFFNDERQIVDSAYIQLADETRALMPGI